MKYYLIENEIITKAADYKFDENCLMTEQNIVRGDDGVLYLENDWNAIIQTQEYQTELLNKEKALKKAELQEQINKLDIKRIRSLAEGGNYNEETTWLEYYNQQIQNLREEIATL